MLIDSQAFADWLNTMTQSATGDFYAGYFLGVTSCIGAAMFIFVGCALGTLLCWVYKKIAAMIWRFTHDN